MALSQGATGPDVKQAHARLWQYAVLKKREGADYFKEMMEVDDVAVPPVFGPATREAVLDLQSTQNLEKTGILDDASNRVLVSIAPNPPVYNVPPKAGWSTEEKVVAGLAVAGAAYLVLKGGKKKKGRKRRR